MNSSKMVVLLIPLGFIASIVTFFGIVYFGVTSYLSGEKIDIGKTVVFGIFNLLYGFFSFWYMKYKLGWFTLRAWEKAWKLIQAEKVKIKRLGIKVAKNRTRKGERPVKFDDAILGAKEKKRPPTQQELDLLEDFLKNGIWY